MSMLRSNAQNSSQGATQSKKSPDSVFNTPDAYHNYTLQRLRNDFSGDWWLNVDYVESHSGGRTGNH